jgi:hypothetical protein
MNLLAPIRPTEPHSHHVRLTSGPTAPAEARARVKADICAWGVPVDPDTAVLLTSELVTNAIRQEVGGTVTVVITCSGGEFRVDVHDASRSLPVLVDALADAEAGRGLMLVTMLSADWGAYRTPAGKAVYFTLAFQPRRARRAPVRKSAALKAVSGESSPHRTSLAKAAEIP